MTGVKEKNDLTTNSEEKNKCIIPVPIKHPIEIDGVLINSITLDFSNFTGEDILKIDEQLRLEGSFFDHLYNQKVLLKLASFGANMKIEDLKRLHGADFLEVTLQTRNFFIQW
jgi:hypothetical protein